MFFVLTILVHVFVPVSSKHLQDIAQEAVKKRRRTTKKPYSRSIVRATLEVILKRRTEKPEVRDAAREAALPYNFLHLGELPFCSCNYYRWLITLFCGF